MRCGIKERKGVQSEGKSMVRKYAVVDRGQIGNIRWGEEDRTRNC